MVAKKKPAPLGRGLSALFGDADTSYQARPSAVAVPSQNSPITPSDKIVQKMPIEFLQPGMYQPRRHFDEEALGELSASIKERGVLQPLLVRAIEGLPDSYEIIAGERRWRAAQLAGLHEVPVLVQGFSDRDTMEVSLIENVQREDLSALEEAEGYKRLINEFGYAPKDLSKAVGKSENHINNLVRLLKLPESVQKMVLEGLLTMGHARALITADDPEELAKIVVKKGLSVRQTEALGQKVLNQKMSKSSALKAVDPDIAALEKDLEKALGLKVKLQTSGLGGRLTFFYSDLDQLDLLLKKVTA